MRNLSIDVLRAISILLVLLHHFNIPYKLQDTWLDVTVFGSHLAPLLARNGNYGVTLFFVISGFLITQHSLQRDGTLANIRIKDFYIRRIARIVPCLLLLLVMVTALGSLGLKPFLNQAPNDIDVPYWMTLVASMSFWMNILIIQNGWVNYALGVLWSLSVEEVFYLAFPLLAVLLHRNYRFVIFLLLIIAYAPYFRFLHFGEESEAYLYHYFASFDAIAIGCLTALLSQQGKMPKYANKMLLWLCSILMVILYVYAPIKAVSTWSMTVFALLSAGLIWALSQSKPHKVKSSIKMLVWIGQRSYEMYLFHLIVLGLIKVFYVPKMTTALEKFYLFWFFIAVTFVLSWLIEKYYATPCNRWIRQRFIR